MAESKNLLFDRPGGYAMPSGATKVQRDEAARMAEADVHLYGDALPAYEPRVETDLKATYEIAEPRTRLYVGDCRDVLASLREQGERADLIFADPPFNWDVPYSEWNDGMPRQVYERFTYDWLDGCVDLLSDRGALWVNIPDDTAAEIVIHLKRRGLTMMNWCAWHFRFGQNRESSFIMSKVHALYFVRDSSNRTWNPEPILEPSDRATIYNDARTMAKENNKGMRVPMDVWYGKYWGRIQGNNKERRDQHHNQIPEAYLERVVLSCSNPGDLVLDPFTGSGTTSTVARHYGRDSVCIEYAEQTAASAWQRISEVGMIRPGEALGQSSAIFENRSATKRKKRAAASEVSVP